MVTLLYVTVGPHVMYYVTIGTENNNGYSYNWVSIPSSISLGGIFYEAKGEVSTNYKGGRGEFVPISNY